MKHLLKRTWAEINLDRLAYNVSLLKQQAADKELMAVVKADAYGHGDRMIAAELARLGVTFFGVSNVEEALSLRSAGIKGEILILGATPTEFADVLADQKISQAIFSAEYAQELSNAACAAGVKVKGHLKLDTGMGRIGFRCPGGSVTPDVLKAMQQPGLLIEGVFSHLSVADALDADSIAYTAKQQENFDVIVDALESRGFSFRYIHLQNSAAIMNRSDSHCNLVRMGIAMYGLAPSEAFSNLLPLKPLMELKTTISMVKELPAGESVSYGRSYTANQSVRVATVPVGYADGYHRVLSNKASMMLHGKRAPVIGRICMDQLMLDVSEIPQAKAGDVVTVFGDDLSVDELAVLAGTINYELVCAVSRRVPRVYLKNGSVLDTVDYLLDER